MFKPTKDAACNALEQFLPRAGRDYAAGRNYDTGQKNESTVSRLSPWIRNRTLAEWEVLGAVLEQHSTSAASKFVDEICWRTYWKGWLQLRPGVWDEYVRELNKLLEQYDNYSGYREAIKGRTGIDCFDAWNSELIESNYLHNHSRMWYASIWVHTLKLPWQLGADWFLRHLLDGDPASNTLSWRWVAGLHTPGKTYLARPGNIRKYTNNRFEVNTALAEKAVGIDPPPIPQAQKLKPLEPIDSYQRLGLLVTDEDLSVSDWIKNQSDFVTTAGYYPQAAYEKFNIVASVRQFRRQSMVNAGLSSVFDNDSDIIKWVSDNKLDGIIMAEPTPGPTADAVSYLNNSLTDRGLSILTARHWWDETLYPHATHGFFRFKKAIPRVLERINEPNQILPLGST